MMRINSCSLRRYTLGRLPKDKDPLINTIKEINDANAQIDEYDENSLYRLFEDADDVLYFDGPEFNLGDIDITVDDEGAINLRKLIAHGASVKSIDRINLDLSVDYYYCCTDQQGSGDTDYCDASEGVEEIINSVCRAIDSGVESSALAGNLVLLTKTWCTPWQELTMFTGIATADATEPEYKDHWGDGSYSMHVNHEEASIYSCTSSEWAPLAEDKILQMLERSGISVGEWSELASEANVSNFFSELSAGGYGFGLVPFIQDRITSFMLTDADLALVRSRTSDEATITACFAHSLSYDPIKIDLPTGCKYMLQIFSPSADGEEIRPLSEQLLKESINIRISGINYRGADGALRQYELSYRATECMVDFSIEADAESRCHSIVLQRLNISIPLIGGQPLQEMDNEQIMQDQEYRKRLDKWRELGDAACRKNCLDIVGIGVQQSIEFDWLKV